MIMISRHSRQAILVILLALGAAIALHLSLGAKVISIPDIFTALSRYDDKNYDHIIIWKQRLPRMIVAISVGSALSVAGALMQGVTRNPLADPGLLGLMSGAAFGVVFGTTVFGITDERLMPLLAAFGALLATAIVATIAVSTRYGRSTGVLLLAGAAVAACLKAIVSGVNILNDESFAQFRVWLSGVITADAITVLPYAGPPLFIALLYALLSARKVTALSLGHEAATGLGVNATSLYIKLLVCTVVLTASAVCMVGPLGFVGLVVPHATRLLVGSDYRWVIPCSAIIGGTFLLIVDIIARLALAPSELSTGIVTSLVGAPVFLALVRRQL